jgi:hypothetical protein
VLIVDDALSSSALWSSVKVLHLTENMCLKANGLTDDSIGCVQLVMVPCRGFRVRLGDYT